MKKIVIPFKIDSVDKSINFSIPLLESRTILKDFAEQNAGADGEATYEIVEKVPYGFHKWYRGYLLPTIAQSLDKKEIKRMHMMLKYDYLREAIDGWENIPDRYLKSGIAIITKDYLSKDKTKFINNFLQVPSGRNIVILEKYSPVEIIKSNAVLTQKEMRSFILDCELIIQGLVDAPEPDKSLIRYRDDVMK